MALKKRRRPTIASGMSGSRDTLVADIKADTAQADYDRRSAEAEQRRIAAETWAKEVNRVKELAQKFQDGEIPLEDFNKDLDGSSVKFADHSGEIESLRRAAIRNRDTQTYNNYIQGGIDFESWEDFAKLRQKDGGDLSHLTQLVAQARGNEDKVQYGQYQAGLITYAELERYAADRAKGGGSMDKLNGYVALAKTNENKIQDQLKGTAYNAGQLSDEDYEAYLTERVNGAKDPAEASQLRIAIKTVQNNSVLKKADDIRADYEMDAITGGTAAARLIALRSSTNDATVQKQLSTLVGQIQAKDAQAARSGSGSASATVTAMQTALNTAVNQQQSDYDKTMSAINTKSGKAGVYDYAKLTDEMFVATSLLKNTLATASRNSPDPLWQGEHAGKLSQAQAIFSNKLFQLATTIAENMTKPAEGQVGVDLKAAGDAAKFLIITASANPYMRPEDRLTLIQTGQQKLANGLSQWWMTSDGVRFRDLITNRTNELNTSGGSKILAELMGLPAGQTVDESLVQELLLYKPDVIREALTRAGVPEFAHTVAEADGLRNLVKGATPDEFSKSIAEITSVFRALNDANNDIYRQSGVYGLNSVQTAQWSVIAPDFESFLHSTDKREALRGQDHRGGEGDPSSQIFTPGNNYDMEAKRLGNVNIVPETRDMGNIQQLLSRDYTKTSPEPSTFVPVQSNADPLQRAGEQGRPTAPAPLPAMTPPPTIDLNYVSSLLAQRQNDMVSAAVQPTSGLMIPSAFQLGKVDRLDAGVADPYAQEALKVEDVLPVGQNGGNDAFLTEF